jgi:hypothetical protein
MPSFRETLVTWTVAFGEKALPPLERWLGQSSLVGDQPFFDVEHLPWARRSRRDWREDPRRAR